MNIIIVDEYALVQKALASFINNEEDMQVIDEASGIKEAIEKICGRAPDVVLIGTKISDSSTAEIITECRELCSKTSFMVLAANINETDFRQFFKCGVEGYILMQAMPDELLYAIRLLNNGKRYYDCQVMDIMIGNGNCSVSDLTPRELDVLMALGKGMNNKLISQKLFITEFTVKKHVGQILSKLNLKDRTEAALYANFKGISEYKFG